eukprot:GCRY01003006.1.p1 GENE.GCRY01003006.1~~GCRY01003006.1.p1  ORF type:complete len:363 (-),score=87.43 GCRY01003006.1:48-1136(-)
MDNSKKRKPTGDDFRKYREEKSEKKFKKLVGETAEDDSFQSKQRDSNDLEAIQSLRTVSIALPGSIVTNAQTIELKTYLCGQIARACGVFKVDEIIVFNEETKASSSLNVEGEMKPTHKEDSSVFMCRILNYLECPQYLRKFFFPKHRDLSYAGLLNPLDAPHQMRADEWSRFREGVVANKKVKGDEAHINVGLDRDVRVKVPLKPGVRVTVDLGAKRQKPAHKKLYTGELVSPSTPVAHGTYWGYTTRLAKTFKAVFEESPYDGGYDHLVGTSERGKNVYDPDFKLPEYKHLLIVFGGLHGLEESLESDDRIHVADPAQLFHTYINPCPNQGSRTIRTEEAILVTMSALAPHLQPPAPSSS